jgi:hypothetical protein
VSDPLILAREAHAEWVAWIAETERSCFPSDVVAPAFRAAVEHLGATLAALDAEREAHAATEGRREAVAATLAGVREGLETAAREADAFDPLGETWSDAAVAGADRVLDLFAAKLRALDPTTIAANVRHSTTET